MNRDEWLQYGVDNGFCTEPFCYTHDPMPETKAEEIAWLSGDDPCVVIMRLGNKSEWLSEKDLTEEQTRSMLDTETKESANGTI